MARHCNFDRKEKLILAMELFWQKGYAQTSIADLVAKLDINRFSLYNSFGDKLTLYREALEYYLSQYSFPSLHAYLHENANLTDIEQYLSRFVEMQKEQKYGCFLQNAVLEKCLDDECVQQACQRLFEQLQQRFTEALLRSQTQGKLIDSAEPVAISAFLLMQLQGIRVLGKASQYEVLANAQEELQGYLNGLKR